MILPKAELRARMAAQRDAIRPELRQAKSDALWRRLVELPVFQQASQAFFYVTHGSEVETGMMRHLSRELGMLVAAPRAEPGTRKMAFHRLDAEEELVPGPYGILQPAAALPLAQPGPGTVVLVPGLAFDRHCHRLGFGGGYYDRWLAGEGRGLPTVGLGFQEQRVDAVPVEAHDVALQWVLTDQETIERA